MAAPHPIWSRAELALTLLAINPEGLGGLWLRARSGPVRDRFLSSLDALPAPVRKLHPRITDDQLFGGVDIAATLSSGRVVQEQGLLSGSKTLILTMAERCEAGLSARLAQTLDCRKHCLIALDEGADPDETLPPALSDRMAFHIDLNDVALGQTGPIAFNLAKQIDNADIATPDEVFSHLTKTALSFGISSLRAVQHTLEAAKAHAALFQRKTLDIADLQAACELVLVPRAVQFPDADDAPAETPPNDRQSDDCPRGDSEQMDLPEEILLEAVQALLPPDLLAQIARQKAPRSSGNGSGDVSKGNRRGRPLPPQAGRLDGTTKIDLVSTLRAAAPWQPMRRMVSPRGQALHIRPADIRVKRFEEQSDRLLIFTVDASGSAAMSRLNEAKGAVELLLAEAYARRDHVALVAFRGTGADVLLQPTRSLVQTKRQLAQLPGGGGTPLAAGLQSAMGLAKTSKSRGMTPTIALLTDGRANIALDGSAARVPAGTDAEKMADTIAAQNIASVVIDVSKRPHRALESLAGHMRAPYMPLPRADARSLSTALSAALAD
ncbi:magnesium chelatase subunit D [Nereida sp. MMG025]|uniref:magnesium chelatase subunit D n=1 Tax=Nereida sp. MMG025 TaxID=2909981 RepID=UPI001F3AB573|nr:magnesium chelatase subunit D [Nereida sp. MMG025]MCF6445998.1 magnesium chelatase subunit D [Nereida sp. MMG025]